MLRCCGPLGRWFQVPCEPGAAVILGTLVFTHLLRSSETCTCTQRSKKILFLLLISLHPWSELASHQDCSWNSYDQASSFPVLGPFYNELSLS